MNKKVIVIGGGVIGLSSALALAKRGAEVQVLEKSQVGEGCSYGNAGWVTPCFALPLPMPGLFWQSLKWLVNPESPLYIKPAFSSDLAKWLIKFLRSMDEGQALRATEALVKLSKKSLELYRELAIEFQGEFDFQEQGLLMVSESEKSLKALREELRYVGQFGVRGEELSAAQIQAREPILKAKLTGGVFFPEEAHLDPLSLMQTLKKRCLQLGVVISENTEVVSFASASRAGNQQLTKLTTSNHQELAAEVVVLATGSWSKALGKNLSLNVPILGGKGYSMILPKLAPDLKQPIMVLDRKLAITSHKDRLRIAGTLELVDQDFAITQRRADVILRGAKETLGLDKNIEMSTVKDLWVGLRPCTPDGVPMIGFTKKYTNLFLACGHQMLGLQSGIGTGALVADLVEGRNSDLNSPIFSADRFS